VLSPEAYSHTDVLLTTQTPESPRRRTAKSQQPRGFPAALLSNNRNAIILVVFSRLKRLRAAAATAR
jgi:hypothetical protein